MHVLRTGIAMSWIVLLAASAGAQPAMSPTQHTPSGSMPMMMQHMQAMEGPAQPGQAAFGAIREIVGMLQRDPHTDWSKVDVDALRQHLIDMDEVTMRADARKLPMDNGLRIEITGTGRTLEAIQRMVPNHARDIDGMNGWAVQTGTIPNGVVLTVTTANPADVQKIHALEFMGIMVLGTHQPHHLAMARGEPMPMHH